MYSQDLQWKTGVTYLWLKTFHVTAVMMWVGGVLITSLGISIAARFDRPRSEKTMLALTSVRLWDRRVTSPAMILFWILGIVLGGMSEFYVTAWFWMKVSLAFALGGLHGSLSGSLRKMATDPTYLPSEWLRWSGLIIPIAILMIVALVVFKPS